MRFTMCVHVVDEAHCAGGGSVLLGVSGGTMLPFVGSVRLSDLLLVRFLPALTTCVVPMVDFEEAY